MPVHSLEQFQLSQKTVIILISTAEKDAKPITDTYLKTTMLVLRVLEKDCLLEVGCLVRWIDEEG